MIAVERFSGVVNEPESSTSLEIGSYMTGVADDERTDAELMAAIRGHWSASENGTHYRCDVLVPAPDLHHGLAHSEALNE